MSGILEKLHLKHPQNAAGTTNTTQPMMGQQSMMGQQPMMGQQSMMGQPMMGQQQYQPGTFGYNRMPRDQKAAHYEQKAMMYQNQGNMAKAQKNRDKAMRHRQMLAPGYVAPARTPQMRNDKAARLEQKALMYEQKGNANKALRSRQRAQRIRQKHGLGGAVFSQGMQPGMMGQGMQQGMMGQPGMMGGAVQHETIVMPAIVQETVRTDRIVEVQPVIHREVDQAIVHHIEKHITEAPAANRGGVVQMAPIVQETIRPHVIDEVTPVIHREVARTVVERVEEHQAQHVVAPTQHTKETVFENRAGAGFAPGYQVGTFGYPRISRDQKAARYEQKAQEWERKGNMQKAQKNREKALRHRQRMQPGFAAPTYTPQQRMERYNRMNQKAQMYEQRGNPQKAQLARQRAQRMQTKHGLRV